MDLYFLTKCAVSGLIVGVVSEIARRSPGFAAIIASLPLTSILAMIWLYHESKDLKAVYELSNGIALVVLPSLIFFVALSLLIRSEWNFWPSLLVSSLVMSAVYFAYSKLLSHLGLF